MRCASRSSSLRFRRRDSDSTPRSIRQRSFAILAAGFTPPLLFECLPSPCAQSLKARFARESAFDQGKCFFGLTLRQKYLDASAKFLDLSFPLSPRPLFGLLYGFQRSPARIDLGFQRAPEGLSTEKACIVRVPISGCGSSRIVQQMQVLVRLCDQVVKTTDVSL
jgi:hypothetical protein